MSTSADMLGCQLRNSDGYPAMASGRDGNQASGASIIFGDSRQLMPIVMLACFLSGGALLGCVFTAWLLPARITAEIRAEMAQRQAKVEAEVDVAKYEASIAKNTAQKLEIKLQGR